MQYLPADILPNDQLIKESVALLGSNFGHPTCEKTERLKELRQELFKRFTDEQLKTIFPI